MILIILMISHKGLHRNLPLDGPWIISRVHPVWRRWRKPSRFLNPIMLVTFFHFPKIPIPTTNTNSSFSSFPTPGCPEGSPGGPGEDCGYPYGGGFAYGPNAEDFEFHDVIVTEWTIGGTEVAGWGQVCTTLSSLDLFNVAAHFGSILRVVEGTPESFICIISGGKSWRWLQLSSVQVGSW